MRHGSVSYQPGTTVLTFEEELSLSPDQPATMQALLWRPSDTEGSSNSEGSHATGDSGRYSHDETELTNLSSGPSSRPPSLAAEDSGGSATEPDELLQESQTDVKVMGSVEGGCCHQEGQIDAQAAPSQVCGPLPECV